MKIHNAWQKTVKELKTKGLVLMYHRVIDLAWDPWQLCVSPKHFEEQMKVLKRYGHPVQMQEMGRTIHSWRLGRKQIVVTFDDGYADNFYNAKPILERYKIPATFFVVTDVIDKNEEFWWDDLERITLASARLPAQFKMTIANKEYFWPLKFDHSKEKQNYALSDNAIPANGATISPDQLYFALWKVLSYLSFEEKKRVLSQIAAWADQRPEVRKSHKIMTKEELLNLARIKLFEVGAHTQHHPLLTNLSVENQRQEIGESKKFLEKVLDRPVRSFSYPHGAYTADTVKLVREMGFDASCTCVVRQAVATDDPLLLPRFCVLDWDGPTFEENLKVWLNG